MTTRSVSCTVTALLALAIGCGGSATPPDSTPRGPDADSPEAPLTAYRSGMFAAIGHLGAGVAFFKPGVSGAESPSSTLQFGPSQKNACSDVAFDAQGRLYVEFYQAVAGEPPGHIDVYPNGASGEMAPTRIVTAPGLGNSALLTGLAVSSTGEIYVLKSGGASTSAVFVFSPESDSTPVRTISGNSTQMSYPSGLAVDAAGRVYVGTDDSDVALVFAPGADGDVAPTSTLRAEGMRRTQGLAVDADGRVFATVSEPPGVVVFNRGAVERTISGAATGLSAPFGVAVDRRGRVYVTNDGAVPVVRVFAASASGNVSPEAVLSDVAGSGAAVAP
jgi:sugar lactone lactonase YvrE